MKNKTIVMAVNNPATNDYRVVKTAEALAKEGYLCHVVGVWKKGFQHTEKINNVHYHRVRLGVGIKFLLISFIPRMYAKYRSESTSNRKTISKNKLNHNLNYFLYVLAPFAVIIVPFKILYSKIKRYFRFLFVRPFKILYSKIKRYFRLKVKAAITNSFRKLHPSVSSRGVKYLQGRYLASFYDILFELDGDIYYAHELYMLEACSLASKNKGKPFIYDSHELELHRNNNWSKKSNITRVNYERKYIYSADVIFSVSNGCVRNIKKQYNLNNVFLLRNTPVYSTLISTKRNLRDEFGISGNATILIYTGSVTTNRGVDLIIEALAFLEDVHLVTIGPHNNQTVDELKQLSIQKGVESRFHMHQKVPPNELISLCSQGDIAVIPIQDACLSYRYCMPNKLFESAFAGLPIVASSLPDMKEFIDEYNLGHVFKVDSVDSLVKNINKINNELRIEINKNIDKVINETKFEEESKRLISICNQLVNKFAEVHGAN